MTSEALRVLDLFSGGGGFAVAASLFPGRFKPVGFVESDPLARRILRARWPGVPVYGDVATFLGARNSADIITAGFPCQDLSSANHSGKGLAGKRSGLFWHAIRIVRDVEPRYLILENVPNLLTFGCGGDFGSVLGALANLGYDAEWAVLSAADVGAPHQRKRLWILAYPHSLGCEGRIVDQSGKAAAQRLAVLGSAKGGGIPRPSGASLGFSWPPRPCSIADFPRATDGI